MENEIRPAAPAACPNLRTRERPLEHPVDRRSSRNTVAGVAVVII